MDRTKLSAIQSHYLEALRHLRGYAFRVMRRRFNGERLLEMVDAVQTFGWKTFLESWRRNPDVPTWRGTWCVQAVWSVMHGRRLEQYEHVEEPMDKRCQQREGIRVISLDEERPNGRTLAEILPSRRNGTNPAETVPVSADFDVWRSRQRRIERRAINLLLKGYGCEQIGRMLGKHDRWVWQLRQRWAKSWK